MPVLTWEEVLANKDLIGGDIESVEGGVPYRGPLSSMTLDGDTITFTSPWTARLDPDTCTWKKWYIDTCSVNTKMAQPEDIGEGRIFFTVIMLGHTTLFPKDGSKLDDRKVVGLPKASARFLSLFPGLKTDQKFNREAAEQAFVGRSFGVAHDAAKKLPAEATLQDLISCFRFDSSAEAFLWHYVEAVTGEKDVHLKIY